MPLWSPDGRAISFLHTDAEPEVNGSADMRVEDADLRFERVWTLDPDSRALHALTPDGWQVYEYAWSPDGKIAIVANQGDPTPSGWYAAQLYVVDVAGGEPRQVFEVGDGGRCARWPGRRTAARLST